MSDWDREKNRGVLMAQEDIEKKLLSSRKDLLDIGLRNSMINFRSGPKSLLIVDELSEDVLKILYQNKAMAFAPMPEKRLERIVSSNKADKQEDVYRDDSTLELLHELENVDWSLGMDTEGGTGSSRRHTDTMLQTAVTKERLFLSLLKIHTEAETYIEEKGVNILYLALSFLHWYEADASEKLRKAPLLLVPVELKRGGTKDAFHIEYNGDDLIENLSLAAKLKTDFALDLPQYMRASNADAEDMPLLGKYWEAVSECISNQKRWKVVPNEIYLGFFSFGKFLMFNDLDPEVWPSDKPPSGHGVLTRLLGDGFVDETPAVSEDTHLDTVISPGEVRFVRDADSSQTLAILEARGGRNLVIQGPPGTGKSQTITNIIAELLGNGKTVLFVSEKMAALEVVKRRLDENHLGDAVLELHSHKATKQSVLKELARTLDQGQPIAPDGVGDIKALTQVRDSLNAYCEAVNGAVGASGVPFISALGTYLKLKRENESLPVWPFEPMQTWSQKDQARLRETVSELAMHLQEMGQPSLNPFWGSTRVAFSPVEQTQITDSLGQAISLLHNISGSADQLAELLGLNRPVTLVDVAAICRAAQRAAEAPRLHGVRLSTDDWQLRRDSVRALIKAGARMTAVRSIHGDMLIEHAWAQDLLNERQHFSNYGDKWWRLFSGKFRQSRARLEGFCKNPLPKENADCLALIDGVLEYQQQKQLYDKHAALGEALFGAQWTHETSDWEVLSRLSEWVFTLYDDLGNGELPVGIVNFLSGHPDASQLGGAITSIRESVNKLRHDLDSLITRLVFGKERSVDSLLTLPLGQLHEQLQLWLAGIPQLYQLARFNQLREEMAALGLEYVAEQATHWNRKAADIVQAFDLSWYSGLVEQGYANAPVLLKFDRVKQEHLIDRFRRLDQSSLGHAQAELAKTIWARQPRITQPGEMAIIRNELNKKRRLMPIRQLIDQAGRAMQQIKPVFMMSPMSIANFLPPGKIEFDVVIFDEASQVKAVDAFGAVLRGRQTIVVGDTRQMPPTDFFGREIEMDEEDNVTSDIESVLSMFRARGAQERYLSWHYRSRHESLIAVSNVEFYERKLVIFPASGTHKHATGLKFHYLPDALYDRGRTRTNREEAKAVARAVMKHAATKPELSLGVVAFSVAQRDLIQIEVELLRRESAYLDAFFTASHPAEPFFVKNLENVQGDERDVIYISIGYGRNESGRVAKEFGPVNRVGGERRLNVLISRAKMSMEVFCNFRADHLELDAHASHGVRALKHFLNFAETGELDIPNESGKQADSHFELEVIRALEEHNYCIEPQVGTAGYFIDIAVKDPDMPGRYILAIECDGASYHSARSARDRDRLRQGVLESLGWRFHRIWSTDWFRNPQQELERAVAAIENARRSVNLERTVEATIEPVAPPIITRDTASKGDSATQAMMYRKAELPRWKLSVPLQEAPIEKLASLVKSVVATEVPVHESQVTKRLMEAFGVSRAGSRITERVNIAIQHGHRAGDFHYHSGFLYADEQRAAAVRNRTLLESGERKIELVAPEELDAALLDVIKMGFSINQDAAISEALDMLGFGRASSNITSTLKQRIAVLLRRGHLKREDQKLVAA